MNKNNNGLKKDHAFILMNFPNEKCGSSIAHKSFLFPIENNISQQFTFEPLIPLSERSKVIFIFTINCENGNLKNNNKTNKYMKNVCGWSRKLS